jgi:hypothetical protein
MLLSSASAQVPRYDVESYCKKIANTGGNYSAWLNNACISQEQHAYDALMAKWNSLPSEALAYCGRIATTTGQGSYWLLQACIEQEMSARSGAHQFRY